MSKLFLLAIALCFLFASCLVSRSTSTTFDPNKMLLENWEWTQEAWTGSDAPYVAIRHNVDRTLAPLDRPAAIELIGRYRAQASLNGQDPRLQFKWAYAVVAASKKGYRPSTNDAADCTYALEKAVSPRSYEYARIRFLTAMQWGTYSALKSLGYRLIKRNPTDLHVQYNFSRILANGTAKERQQALSYAQSFVRRYPQWAGSYILIGEVYQEMFYRTRNISMGDKAIAAYLKSIQLAGANYDRRNTDFIMKNIRITQKEWKQNGTAK